jgi:hypothetical protein
MTSEYLARRVLDAAERPRRSLIIPWWFRILPAFDLLLPVVVDGISFAFLKKNINWIRRLV